MKTGSSDSSEAKLLGQVEELDQDPDRHLSMTCSPRYGAACHKSEVCSTNLREPSNTQNTRNEVAILSKAPFCRMFSQPAMGLLTETMRKKVLLACKVWASRAAGVQATSHPYVDAV